MRRGRAYLRLLFVASLILGVLALPMVATAGVDPPGSCSGTATVKGIPYTEANDTSGNPVLVPADEDDILIPWTGRVTFENKGHSGTLFLDTALSELLGPDIGRIPVADWSDPNEGDDRDGEGTYDLDEFWDTLGFRITGLVKLSGDHTASGGSCSGFVMVKFTGNPLGTPIGIIVIVGGIVTGAFTIWAGFNKRGSGGTVEG